MTVLMTENAMTDDFMTITEAARRAYVSDAQVRDLLKHGRLTQATRYGSRWLVSLGELRTVLTSGNGRDGR
jgi:excisionase family DNA binding protein